MKIFKNQDLIDLKSIKFALTTKMAKIEVKAGKISNSLIKLIIECVEIFHIFECFSGIHGNTHAPATQPSWGRA